jgi:hypothetical protein
MLAWSYGLPTSAAWRAIRVRGGAGALGAAGQKCLILETISAPMSLERYVRALENTLHLHENDRYCLYPY